MPYILLPSWRCLLLRRRARRRTGVAVDWTRDHVAHPPVLLKHVAGEEIVVANLVLARGLQAQNPRGGRTANRATLSTWRPQSWADGNRCR